MHASCIHDGWRSIFVVLALAVAAPCRCKGEWQVWPYCSAKMAINDCRTRLGELLLLSKLFVALLWYMTVRERDFAMAGTHLEVSSASNY